MCNSKSKIKYQFHEISQFCVKNPNYCHPYNSKIVKYNIHRLQSLIHKIVVGSRVLQFTTKFTSKCCNLELLFWAISVFPSFINTDKLLIIVLNLFIYTHIYLVIGFKKNGKKWKKIQFQEEFFVPPHKGYEWSTSLFK